MDNNIAAARALKDISGMLVTRSPAGLFCDLSMLEAHARNNTLCPLPYGASLHGWVGGLWG